MSSDASSTSTPLVPRPAATVMVLRPVEENAPDGAYQVFMVRRSTKSAFVPDMYVFPGGSLDLNDSSAAALDRITGLTVSAFRDTPEIGAFEAVVPLSPEQIAGLHLAALRELFEEAGVLLAQDEQGEEFEIGKGQERRTRFRQYRKALQNKELSFVEMLEREKVKADGGRLIYFSHWITPPLERRRFDTRFFVTRVDYGHEAEADEYETTEGVWIEPAKALELHEQKQFNMIYPTIAHLRRLAAQPTLPALLEYARNKEVVPAMPDILPGPTFLLPEPILGRW
jgi:8-oxo-dGTP pyrophosphatase MutT (NUDIX family)